MATKAPAIRYTKAADGVDIAYGEFPGEGTPILWVPKHGQLSIGAWARVPSLLECFDEIRCGGPLFVFDPRGTGLSGPLRGNPSVAQYALDTATVAEAVAKPVHLFSLVGGCHAAARFAAEHPSRVLSLTLFNPSPFELLDSRFMSILENDYDMGVLVFLRIAFDLAPDVPIHEVAAEYTRGFSEQALHRIGEPSVNAAVSLREDLERVQAPVLVIGPDDDVGWPEGRKTAAMLPGATYWKTRVFPFNRELGRAVRERFESFLDSAPRHRAPQPVSLQSNGLSARELDVLRLLAAGKSNREIAEALVLGLPTVATHVRHIYEKTGCANRAAAVAYALRSGLE